MEFILLLLLINCVLFYLSYIILTNNDIHKTSLKIVMLFIGLGFIYYKYAMKTYQSYFLSYILFVFMRAFYTFIKNMKFKHVKENENMFGIYLPYNSLWKLILVYLFIYPLFTDEIKEIILYEWIYILFFNNIIYNIVIGIIISITFMYLSTINEYNKNFLRYQRFYITLKILIFNINGFEYNSNLCFNDIKNMSFPNYNYKNSKFSADINKNISYLKKNDDLIINYIEKHIFNRVLSDIEEGIKNNREISLEICKILENLYQLKQNPIIYIFENY